MSELYKWASIEQFHHVRKNIQKYPHMIDIGVPIKYRGKVKLHGTNAGIQILENDIVCQSRERIISPLSDNNGFASWIMSQKDSWLSLNRKNIVIYGEFAGSSIQKGVAISNITEKIFAVFAIKDMETRELIVEPDEISKIVFGIPRVYVLPWHTDEISINWLDESDNLTKVVDDINSMVDEVEKCDPWVKDTFGIEGIGEGLVFYPFHANKTSGRGFSDYAFKAKGEKHRVVKSDKSTRVEPVVAAGAAEFVDIVLTPARLEQGAEAVGGYEMKNTGSFIKWINADVLKETSDELAAAGLEWLQVNKLLGGIARNWFIEKCKEL